MKSQKFETQWGGRNLSIEVGSLPTQAGGSCVVRYGDTVVLGTATASAFKREGGDFFPLTVDHEERLYAAGKIKTSRFMKRDGRATDEAILVSRLIDRSMRPLFNQEIRNEVQVITTVLSDDIENSADVVGIIAASCAMHMSNIPWNGPIAGIRVGIMEAGEDSKKPFEFVINPTIPNLDKLLAEVIICGTEEKVIMLEAKAKEIPEEQMNEAILFGKKHLAEPIDLIKQVQKKFGKEKLDLLAPADEEEAKALEEKKALVEEARKFALPKIQKKYFGAPKASKGDRSAARHEIEKELDQYLKEKGVEKEKREIATEAIYKIVEAEVSRVVLEEGKRVDGRKLDEVRELGFQVGVLPRTHGSGLFTRGETIVLTTATLGAPSLEQIVENMEYDFKKRYFHHYSFAPFSVGDTKPMRGPGRREIGHGALAEKALVPVLPSKEEFPYTVRTMSETISSNGSSSMASTCGSTLALLDAGVPIKALVAGVAIGLASNEKGDYKILTDLQDLEDGEGGMDFKITGTEKGITAIQLDTKTAGLTDEIVKEALESGLAGRLEILKQMKKVISEPRKELSQYAPRIHTIQIPVDKIRDVIGPGGKIINEIIDKTGVEIDIEQTGLVSITAMSEEAAQKALKWIDNLTREVKAGEVFEAAKITRIMDFGAFAEVLPGQEGLIHISEMAPFHVRQVEDVLKVGDEVPVLVKEIDSMGRINLSLKDAPGYSVEKYGNGADKFSNESPAPRSGGGFGGGRSFGGSGGGRGGGGGGRRNDRGGRGGSGGGRRF